MYRNADSVGTARFHAPLLTKDGAGEVLWYRPTPLNPSLAREEVKHTDPAGNGSRWVHRAFCVSLIALIASGAVGSVRADQVVARDVNQPDVLVTGVHGGRLEFRTISGETKAEWISDVNLITIDRTGVFADLNQAERFVDGSEPDKAIERYRRALRLSEGFWTELIAARLLMACERAGWMDQVARSYVQVARGESTGVALAARLIPAAMPTERGKRTADAMAELDTAIAKERRADVKALLRFFRYELLRQTGDRRAEQAIRDVAVIDVPPDARTARVFAIQLTALREALAGHPDDDVWASLDRAVRWAPDSTVAAFLLLKGNALLEVAASREELIRAGWVFLRIPIHLPDDPLAADGLVGAATAMERLELIDKAAALLDEALAHERISKKTRTMAERALERLRASGP